METELEDRIKELEKRLDSKSEIGWVIVHNTGFQLLYWNGLLRMGDNIWTSDNLKAIRFARKEDASNMLKCLTQYVLGPNWLDVSIEEHMWLDR